MDPTLEFLKEAGKHEFTTGGGYLDFIVMALLSLSAAGADKTHLILQTYEVLFKVLRLAVYAFERVLEFLASFSSKSSFRATPPPADYAAPKSDADWKPLVALGVLLLACMAILQASRRH